nr:amidase family protein [Streptomyces albus]
MSRRPSQAGSRHSVSGSDVAISVRGPAADTGIASIKPTHGRVPMTRPLPRRTAPLVARRPHGPQACATCAWHSPSWRGPTAATPTPWRCPPQTAPAARAGFASAGPPRRSARSIDRSPHTVAAAATALTELGHDVRESELPWLAERDCTLLSATLFPAEVRPRPARRHFRPRGGGAPGRRGDAGVPRGSAGRLHRRRTGGGAPADAMRRLVRRP